MKNVVFWMVVGPFLIWLVYLSLEHPTRWNEQRPAFTGCADVAKLEPCK